MWFIIRYLWILGVYTIASFVFMTFVNLFYKFDYLSSSIWDDYDTLDEIYDYIIVGAGSAGCILAARLAENAAHRVLLIEAGGQPSSLFDIPLGAPMLQLTPYDWQFKTEPQDNACLGMKERRSVWPRGKVVGGTSRLNYMMYVRGHPTDYDSWRSEDCKHWTRHEIRGYFKRSEHQRGLYANDSKYHSTRGLVSVSDLEYVSPIGPALLEAAQTLGVAVGDLNGELHGAGFMQAQATSLQGARFSADRVLAGRANIKVLTHTQVIKVLMKQNFEAYGVRCVRHGRYFSIRARRDVILSAGAIGSPHILMLSGIGPAKHLAQHNIKVAVDLPVGENLQDHVASGLDLVITNQSSPLSWQAVVNPLNPVYYFLYGQAGDTSVVHGLRLSTLFVVDEYTPHPDQALICLLGNNVATPQSTKYKIPAWVSALTHPGCEVVGLVNSESPSGEDSPDLQFMLLPGGLSSDAGVVLKPAMGVTDQLWRSYFADLVDTPVATLLPTLTRPLSRGYVRLQSRNYKDPPLINPRYLSHPNDVKVLTRGLEFLVRLAETEAMTRVGSTVYAKPLPPCAHLQFRSAVYWECYIRHITVSAYHIGGTCRMGSRSDPSTVVDHTLRVHGTSRLRVVDASVMPNLPSSNTNAAVMMIAEKAADLVKAYWHSQQLKCSQLEVFHLEKPATCV